MRPEIGNVARALAALALLACSSPKQRTLPVKAPDAASSDAGTSLADAGEASDAGETMDASRPPRSPWDAAMPPVDAAIEKDAAPSDAAARPDSGDQPEPDAGVADPDCAAGTVTGSPFAPADLIELPLPARALVGDPGRGRVYAVLGSAEPYPDRLITIDSGRAMVVHDVEIGSDPTVLAISDDASTLWVGLAGSAELRRVDLTGEFPMPGERQSLVLSSTSFHAGDLVVLPGTTDSVAVSLRLSANGHYSGVVFVEDGVVESIGRDNRSVSLTGGPDGYVFGFDNLSTGYQFYGIDVAAGSVDAATYSALVHEFETEIFYDGDGYVYATSGEVVDVRTPSAPRRAGVFAYSGAVLPQAGGDRALMTSIASAAGGELVLRHLDTATFAQRSTTPLGAAGVHVNFVKDLVHAGPDSLAFIAGSSTFGNTRVYLANGSGDPFAACRIPSVAAPIDHGALVEIPVDARTLVADPVRKRLYATVTGGSAAFENRLVTIDPSVPAVVDELPVGSDPDTLAISDDASTLWVGIAGSYAIRRIDLSGSRPTPTDLVPLPFRGGDPTYVQSIVVLPQTTRSIAAVLSRAGWYAGEVVALDDGALRPTISSDPGFGPDQLVLGPSGYLFGFGLSSDYPFFSLVVDASGVTQTRYFSLVHGERAWIASDPDGFVYASPGMVVDVQDPATPLAAGFFSFKGGVLPLPNSETALMVSPSSAPHGPWLRNLDTATFTQRGAIALGDPGLVPEVPSHAVRLEPNTVAFVARSSSGTGASVYLVDEAVVEAALAIPDPTPAVAPLAHGDLVELPVSAHALVADPVRPRLYATIAGDAPVYANRLVTIDAETGAVIDSVPIGAKPAELAISDDGSTLWVSIRGSYEIRRVDLATGPVPTPGPSYRLPPRRVGTFIELAEAETMVVLPGLPGSVAVALHHRTTSPSTQGIVVLDDGVARPTEVPWYAGPSRIAPGPSGYLFSYADRTSDGLFYTLEVAADGLVAMPGRANLVDCCFADISYDPDGFVYSTLGHVVDVTDPTMPVSAGSFPFTGAVLPIAASDTALMVSITNTDALVLRTLSTASLAQLTSRVLLTSATGPTSHLVRTSVDSIAFIAGASAGHGTSLYLWNDPALFQ